MYNGYMERTLAIMFTMTTYGTWLRGDMRGWVERLLTERNYQILRAVEEASVRLGKTLSQVALAWLLAMPGVTSAIIGARSLAQLRENLGAGGWDFPADEWKKLDEASALPLEYPQDFQAWVEQLIHGDLG